MALKVKAIEKNGDSSRAHSLTDGHHDDQLYGQRPTTLRKSPKVERLSGIVIYPFDLVWIRA